MRKKTPKFGRRGTGSLTEAISHYRHYKDASLLRKFWIDMMSSEQKFTRFARTCILATLLLLSFLILSINFKSNNNQQANLALSSSLEPVLFINDAARWRPSADNMLRKKDNTYYYIFTPDKPRTYYFRIGDANLRPEYTFGINRKNRFAPLGKLTEINNGFEPFRIRFKAEEIRSYILEFTIKDRKNFHVLITKYN